jgi:hypothetical protein
LISYAGNANPDRSSDRATDVFVFAIEADADPDVLARVSLIIHHPPVLFQE